MTIDLRTLVFQRYDGMPVGTEGAAVVHHSFSPDSPASTRIYIEFHKMRDSLRYIVAVGEVGADRHWTVDEARKILPFPPSMPINGNNTFGPLNSRQAYMVREIVGAIACASHFNKIAEGRAEALEREFLLQSSTGTNAMVPGRS